MKSKTFSLIIGLALFTVAAQAQDGVSFGLRAGVDFQNINGKNFFGDNLENDLVARYHAGINVELPLAPGFHLQPGLLFTTKGAKGTDNFLGQNVTTTVNLSYIEVPVNLLFKPELGTGRMLLGFGPYVAFGVGGKATTESGGVSGEVDIEFKNEVDEGDPEGVFYAKRVDSGANLLVGYEFMGGLSFQLNAQLGLADINPEDRTITEKDETSFKNTGFGLSLGYRF